MQTALAGDFATAREMHLRLLPAMRACFLETNPIPVKTVLGAMGRIDPAMRLPLIAMDEENRRKVVQAFAQFAEVTV